ncbi:MAG: hypothetical protein AAF660_10990 [Pseudomonadota bacterium]
MKRHALTIACLILALVCYGLGFAMPGNALIVAGVVLEAAFWIRLIRGDRGRDRQ